MYFQFKLVSDWCKGLPRFLKPYNLINRVGNLKRPTGLHPIPPKASNKIEEEHGQKEDPFQPRNFLRRDDSGLPEHREMIPRHFNMHPQREANPRGKHQMDADDMRRFREELSESGKIEQAEQRRQEFEQFRNEGGNRGSKGRIILILVLKSGKLVNLNKKQSNGVNPLHIDPSMSDKEKFNIILNYKQSRIDGDLNSFANELSHRRDQEKIWSEHENLISDILLEEEELLEFHKKNLDMNIKDFEFENQLLNEVDAPGSDIDKYIGALKELLRNKIHAVLELNDMLFRFDNNLKKEKLLNERIHEIMKDNDSEAGFQPQNTDQPPANGKGGYQGGQPQWNNYIQEEQPNYRNQNMISEEANYPKNEQYDRLQEESPSKVMPGPPYGQNPNHQLKVNFGDASGEHMIPGYQREGERQMQGNSNSPRLRALPEGIYRHYNDPNARDDRENVWGGYRREY